MAKLTGNDIFHEILDTGGVTTAKGEFLSFRDTPSDVLDKAINKKLGVDDHSKRYVVADVKKQLSERSKEKCETCGIYAPYILQRHHIFPVEHGGPNTLENLLHVCPNCHAAIHAILTVDENDQAKIDNFLTWVETFSSGAHFVLFSNAAMTLIKIRSHLRQKESAGAREKI